MALMTSQGLGFTLTKGGKGRPLSEASSLTAMRPKGLLRFRSRFARLGSELYIRLASRKEVRALICSRDRDVGECGERKGERMNVVIKSQS